MGAHNEDMEAGQHRSLGFDSRNVPRAVGSFEQVDEDLHT